MTEEAVEPKPKSKSRRKRKPAVAHGQFAARFAGDKFRVTCDCGLDEVVSWPEACMLRAQHGV